MKHLFTFLLLLSLTAASAQSFKVIGYLPYYRFALKDDMAFDKLTHLNLAFANPDTSGAFYLSSDPAPVIATARAQNPDIEIGISIAGGALTADWKAAYQKYMQPQYRSFFCHKIIEYVHLYGFDGVDMDLEWNDVDEKYSPFVIELADSLAAHGKWFTAAWPATYRYPDISDDALAVFDYINMMAYDLTGPWAPNNPGPHSPYSFAQQGITYWNNQGVIGDRLTLGVPFYGYDFTNSSSTTAFTFRQIVNEDTANAYRDQTGMKYYNGIPTIEAKTDLAMQEVSGIMIWEIGQDVIPPLERFSLLDAIDAKVNVASGLPGDFWAGAQAFPNPFREVLKLRLPVTAQLVDIQVRDLMGREVLHMQRRGGEEVTVATSHLPTGVYVATMAVNGNVQTWKMVKR